MKSLTKRQREILDFIQEFIKNNRYAPTYREIAQHFELSSLGSVYKYIHVLKKKGALQGVSKTSRSLTLSDEPQKNSQEYEINIPFIGHLAAGMPIQIFSQQQSVTVPRSFVHNLEKTYALKAQGDSLSEEMIADGDLIVVEARQEAHPGETIVALINNHDTIVKKFYPDGAYVRLIGSHSHHHPIILRQEDVSIQGIVIGLLRSY